MRQVSLREFRTRGVKALKEVPAEETSFLSAERPRLLPRPGLRRCRKGSRRLRRAMALASLREGWRLAEASGSSLATDEEIDAEISRIRATPEDEPECA